MTYEDFLRQVQKDLQDSFANQTEEKYAKVTIGIGNVNKIQGESYRGITFVNGESPIKGHFNMQQAYHLNEHGYSYDEILRQTEEAIKQEVDTAPGFNLEDLQDYSKMKSTLMMQLIPQKGNEENLMKLPHQKIEDLALVYRFDAGGHSGMTATMLITNDSLKTYGITAEQLHQDALENAPVSHPAILKSMREMLAEMGAGGGMAPSPGEPVMMVATTEDSRMGASVIQYPGFLEEATEKMGGDFFILPSSIHEMLLLPDDGKTNYRELAEMVRSINEAQVAPAEQLSNNVYHYDQKDRIFELADKTADRKRVQESVKSTDRREPSARKSSVLEQLGEKKKEARQHEPKAKSAERKTQEAAL